MGIISQWISLKHQLSEIGKPIFDIAFQNAFKSLSALYETTFDKAHWSLSVSDQHYSGHDHDEESGASFTRGLCYSEDTGEERIFDKDFATITNRWNIITAGLTPFRFGALGEYFPSPKLNGTALSGKMLYEAVDGDFKLEVGTVRNITSISKQGYRVLDPLYYRGRKLLYEMTLEQTSDSTTEEVSLRWVDFDIPFFPGEWMLGPMMLVSSTKENSRLRIFNITIVEQPGFAKIYSNRTLDGSRGQG